MKKIVVMMVSVMAVVAAFAMSLADARGQIGKCISDPKLMTTVMKQLSAADQKALLAEVNAAIEKMPGSNEQKSATYLNVNHAALKGAAKGNIATLVAEVFATVPPEVLTIINEQFATDLFSRTADPSKTYSDESFTQVSTTLVKKTLERTSSMDNGAARSAFVILMMVRASGGSPAELQETLIKALPEDAQNAARNEWIPAALGQKQIQSYEPILGGADALNQMPENRVVIRLAGPQLLESMLGDVVEGTPVINNTRREEVYISPAVSSELTEGGAMPGPAVVEEIAETIGYQNQTI